MTLKTPGGRPTSWPMAASSKQVRLHSSEGFKMQQLPAASAGATFHCTLSTTPLLICKNLLHDADAIIIADLERMHARLAWHKERVSLTVIAICPDLSVCTACLSQDLCLGLVLNCQCHQRRLAGHMVIQVSQC